LKIWIEQGGNLGAPSTVNHKLILIKVTVLPEGIVTMPAVLPLLNTGVMLFTLPSTTL